MIALTPSPFEVWAAREDYDTALSVSPCPLRQFDDRDTQKAFEAYQAGAAHVARIVTESTLEIEALRERLLPLPV
jgi:hypothetical protein